jgi:hypothetical protein
MCYNGVIMESGFADVVLEKYWLAILLKDKVTEFRSSNHAIILLNAHQFLLFALPIRHRRNGKDALLEC